MRVLVTGGAGFIGSHLCEALVHQGHQVTVLDDLSTGRFENIEHISGLTCVVDTTLNKDIVRDLVREADVVYHLAATVGVQLVVEQPVRTLVNNIRGTETVLEETSRYRRRLLITSSSEVYGKGMNPEFRETDDRIMGATSLSRWGYAASKAMDEFLALAYWYEKRHPVVIVRLFNTVGTRQTGRYGMVIPRFVAQALRNEPLTVFGDGEQSRCFTYVGDVVPALIKLMERRDLCGEVFNIGGNQAITMKKLAERIIEKTGSTGGVTFVPYEQAYGPGFEDMRARMPSLKKVHDAIGFEPKTSLDEILDVVIEDIRHRLDVRDLT
ncbi:MAG TPA: GDP-mannose 4,6-dehydratase [Candidatus Hydrogenedentes bacterium]|nr:GDP-mannose 4,6-dehydratase [Candidatus Hydrogenedentota bacterium]HQE84814.1 GDP-mannose 4,6-dehydratase [Candidatus Hydrogenedentota bacterium]HQH53148.1 GDP-mannose 4,6-dehydratase [Candidatus Hydrogenedentota bacterium]HQM51100.1 GDP-mannose 4,6-dehydratase [Candidatus Hydrogenedentota bacterium]